MVDPDEPLIKITLPLSQWRAVVRRLDLIAAGAVVIPMDGVAMVDPRPYEFRLAERVIRRAVQLQDEQGDGS